MSKQLELPAEPNTLQLAQVISHMYATTNQTERVALTDYLSKLESNAQNHFTMCLQVLSDPQISQSGENNMFEQDPKMSVSTYLKNFAVNLSKQAAQVFYDRKDDETFSKVRNELKYMMSLLVQTILSNNCENKYKINLSVVLTKFLNNFQNLDTSDQQHESYQLFKDINEEVKKGLNQDQMVNTIQGALLLFETVFISIMGEDKFQKSFEQLQLPLTELANRFCTSFKQDFTLVTQDPSILQNIEHPTAQKLLLSLSILTQWIRSTSKILELHSQQKFGFDNWIYSQAYSAVFIQLLGLSINDQNSAEAASIVAMSGIQKLDQMINTLKHQVLESVNILIEYAYNNLNQSQLARVPFVPKLSGLIPILMRSIQTISTHQRRSQLLQDNQIPEIIVQMLETLVKLADQNQFNQFFTEHMANILVSVCLNLMQTTEEEAQLIINDPTEFVNLALDCCDRQQSNIVKTQACKLLEHICDNVDGGTTCVTTFCSNAINRALRQIRGEPTGQNVAPQQGLWSMENDPFLSATRPEIIVETCFVALTVISYILPKKPHMVPLFQEVLATNIDTILRDVQLQPNASPLEQALAVCLPVRFSLLLGYYADMMFTHDDHHNAFSKMVDYLFRSVSYPKGNAKQVISLQSIDSLITVVSDEDLRPRVAEHIDTVLQITCQSICQVEYSNYFEFVADFVKFYEVCIKDKILPVLQKIIERIVHEHTKLQNNQGNEDSRQLIIKCCNIIRTIVDRECYGRFYDQIEPMLQILFVKLTDPTQIFFDDELVMIIKRMIKQNKKISPMQWELLNTFPAVLTKNKDSLGNLLEAVNLYIVYGQEFLASPEGNSHLKIILALAEQGLFCSKNNVQLANAEGAILFQIVFQYFQNTSVLNEIFGALLERIQQRSTVQPMPKRLVQKHLVLTYLSALIYNPTLTVQHFHQKQMLVPFLSELVKQKSKSKTEYERKLIVDGVSKFLKIVSLQAGQQGIPQDIKALLLPLMQLLVDLTQQLINEQKKKAAKKAKIEMKQNGMNIDDEEGDSDASDDDDSNFEDVDGSDKSDSDASSDDEDTEQNAEEKKTIDDNSLGFQMPNDKNGESDGNESDDEAASSQFDIVVTMDCLVTPVKKSDHVQSFKETLKSLSAVMPHELQPLLNQLDSEQRTMVTEVLKSQAVTLENGETDLRRVVSVRRKVGGATAAAQQNQQTELKSNLQLPNNQTPQ